MKLVFLYHPVKNLNDSLSFYKDRLGFEEAWREGDNTAALTIPDSDVQLMIEVDKDNLVPGGVFLVDSVDSFYADHKNKLEFIKGPVDIPPGRFAIYRDISGNLFRIIDLSKEK